MGLARGHVVTLKLPANPAVGNQLLAIISRGRDWMTAGGAGRVSAVKELTGVTFTELLFTDTGTGPRHGEAEPVNHERVACRLSAVCQRLGRATLSGALMARAL